MDETGSTNDDLLAAAATGTLRPKAALVTAHQTAGRGRLDRRWDAPPGSNLLVTLYLGDVIDGARPSDLMQRVGVAIVAGIEQLTGAPVDDLGLKWPNDVMFDGRKLAGVLAQASSTSGALTMVVGFGVNVHWAPEGAAALGADVAGLHDVRRADVLASILSSLDRLPGDISERYRERLDTIGRMVRVELPGGLTCRGQATGVADDGRLEVTDSDGAVHVFDVGDVVHLRPDRE